MYHGCYTDKPRRPRAITDIDGGDSGPVVSMVPLQSDQQRSRISDAGSDVGKIARRDALSKLKRHRANQLSIACLLRQVRNAG